MQAAITAETVDPTAYARAQRIEDRLIALIDRGEDLADWYFMPDLSSVMSDFTKGKQLCRL
jgi:predicted RNA-binding protein associated with RNAse of E/G family